MPRLSIGRCDWHYGCSRFGTIILNTGPGYKYRLYFCEEHARTVSAAQNAASSEAVRRLTLYERRWDTE